MGAREVGDAPGRQHCDLFADAGDQERSIVSQEIGAELIRPAVPECCYVLLVVNNYLLHVPISSCYPVTRHEHGHWLIHCCLAQEYA